MMKAFEIMTSRSDRPYLVIAGGFGKAVEMLHRKGVYDTDIVCVRQLENYSDNRILHERDMLRLGELREEVAEEVRRTMPRWMPGPPGAAGGTDDDIYLVRTSRGHYFTSPCIGGGDNYYLVLDTLEQLPGLPKEDRP